MADPSWQIDMIKGSIDRGEENPAEIEDIKINYKAYFEDRNIPLESLRTMQDLYDAITGNFDHSRLNESIDISSAVSDRRSSVCSSDRCNSSMVDEVRATIYEQIRDHDVKHCQRGLYAMENSYLPTEEDYLPRIDEEEDMIRKKKHVYRYIAERAVHKFREIGVLLGARECDMKQLEDLYPNNPSERLYKLFECVEGEELEGLGVFLQRICDSLYKERLFELREKVQKIITLG